MNRDSEYLWDIMKCTKTCITAVRERELKKERTFTGIMAENFPNLIIYNNNN